MAGDRESGLPAERVALVRREASTYPPFPYLPSERFPELGESVPTSAAPNPVFAMVRRTFRLLGLDPERYGSPEWNPLGDLITPGMRVLIKPNWVREFNAGGSDDVSCMYTHPSVLRAVLEYVFKALSKTGHACRPGDWSGEVVVGDAPLQSCNLPRLLAESGVSQLVGHLGADGKRVAVRDFRLTLWRDGIGVEGGDPTGHTFCNLGAESLHRSKDARYRRYRVACYDPRLMRRRHAPGRHEYLVANSVLDADVIISLPKLKTHKKSGLTGGLKNHVGIVGHKEFLPHHVKGSFASGGDEYEEPSVLKALHSEAMDVLYGPLVSRSRALRHVTGRGVTLLRGLMARRGEPRLLDGSWMGNDTLWRTILDLNRVVLYYDREAGRMAATPQRRQLVVVDGIIAGEGEGPLAPDPKPLGTIVATRSPAACDTVLARLIGFDAARVTTIARAFGDFRWPITTLDGPLSVPVRADLGAGSIALPLDEIPVSPLVPPPGWEAVAVHRGATRDGVDELVCEG